MSTGSDRLSGLRKRKGRITMNQLVAMVSVLSLKMILGIRNDTVEELALKSGISDSIIVQLLTISLNLPLLVVVMSILNRVAPKRWDSYFILVTLNPALIVADIVFQNSVSLIIGLILCLVVVTALVPNVFLFGFLPLFIAAMSLEDQLADVVPHVLDLSKREMQCNFWSLLEQTVGKVEVSQGMTVIFVIMFNLAIIGRAFSIMSRKTPSNKSSMLLRVFCVGTFGAFMFGWNLHLIHMLIFVIPLNILSAEGASMARGSLFVNCMTIYSILRLLQSPLHQTLAVSMFVAFVLGTSFVGVAMHGRKARPSLLELLFLLGIPTIEMLMVWSKLNINYNKVITIYCSAGLLYSFIRMYVNLMIPPAVRVTVFKEFEDISVIKVKSVKDSEKVERENLKISMDKEQVVEERRQAHMAKETESKEIRKALLEKQQEIKSVTLTKMELESETATIEQKKQEELDFNVDNISLDGLTVGGEEQQKRVTDFSKIKGLGGRQKKSSSCPSAMELFGAPLAKDPSVVNVPDQELKMVDSSYRPLTGAFPFAVVEDQNVKGLKRAKKVMTHGKGKARFEMQDTSACLVPFVEDNTGLFSVFDGHAGKNCATKCVQYFPECFKKTVKGKLADYKDCSTNFKAAYEECDKLLAEYEDEGATAVTLLVWKNVEGKLLAQCANLGDSTAYLVRKGKAIPLTVDHKVTTPSERERVEALGILLGEKATRIPGGLAVSRAFGDHFLKSEKTGLIGEPFVSEVFVLEDGDSYIILASDGLWDVVTGQEAADILLTENANAQEAAKSLLDTALGSKKCDDNVTVIVIKLW